MSWITEVLKRRRREAKIDLDVLEFNLKACVEFEWYEDAQLLRVKIDSLKKKIACIEADIEARGKP